VLLFWIGRKRGHDDIREIEEAAREAERARIVEGAAGSKLGFRF
jgi:hypothetical protein